MKWLIVSVFETWENYWFTTADFGGKLITLSYYGGARGVVVVVVGNGHGDTSSKPGFDWLHFT